MPSPSPSSHMHTRRRLLVATAVSRFLKQESSRKVMGHGTRDNAEKELPSEGIVTWSVLLLLIAVVYHHTFNSGHVYLLDPRRRSCRSELLFRFMEVPFARPQSPCYFCLNIHLAVLRLTGTRERLFRRAASKVSEGVWFGKTTTGICSHGQWFLGKSPHLLIE